jgi:FAD/FMN-containing dehydrogenase
VLDSFIIPAQNTLYVKSFLNLHDSTRARHRSAHTSSVTDSGAIMQISGWGNYPVIDAHVSFARSIDEIRAALLKTDFCLARGLGRSYGDSALGAQLINTTKFDYLLSFDEEKGVVCCTSGVSLAQLLAVIMPKGWFLPVTPGTKFVTVGGAIASDVHGKNHHVHGCFSNYLLDFTLMLADGSVVTCSATEHVDLFRATCGGMGLTGIILTATLKLTRLSSVFINETVYKTAHLQETLALMQETQASTYSAAWVDCLARGKNMGRGLLMLGEHAHDLARTSVSRSVKSMPFNLPPWVLNRYSIGTFNAWYYHRVQRHKTERHTFYDTFFYPLDSINHWNRLYGQSGFTQYQLVLPKEAGYEALTAIFKKVTVAQKGSFLAVLKSTGAANDNFLSFPFEGFSLAIDFKIEPSLFELLHQLDEIVLHYGGRLYLTKDMRMGAVMFKRSYPLWQTFAAVRAQYGAEKFSSLQSVRLGI